YSGCYIFCCLLGFLVCRHYSELDNCPLNSRRENESPYFWNWGADITVAAEGMQKTAFYPVIPNQISECVKNFL
ncbi:MAG: hypothetical protein MR851_09735, partial [[Clostridium] scindens]|uniref:hypothetical protein n=1 Tax=Clostridium scindens (strain JCM 10418 / VPI 12708) TaxID=29347 RepID=UPI00242FE783